MEFDAEATTFLPESLPGAGSARPSLGHPWELYYGDLRKFVARQLGGQQDADDVVQDIYRELLHSRCAEATNPRAYLWKIAWRVVHDAFERKRRQRVHQVNVDPQALESIRSARLSTAAPIDLELEAEDDLLRALEGLPAVTQVAIVRSRRDGWTYEQIAAELGVTPHIVKHHISRAVAHFVRYFRQVDGASGEQGVQP